MYLSTLISVNNIKNIIVYTVRLYL